MADDAVRPTVSGNRSGDHRMPVRGEAPCASCNGPHARWWGTAEGGARLCPTCATLHGLGCP